MHCICRGFLFLPNVTRDGQSVFALVLSVWVPVCTLMFILLSGHTLGFTAFSPQRFALSTSNLDTSPLTWHTDSSWLPASHLSFEVNEVKKIISSLLAQSQSCPRWQHPAFTMHLVLRRNHTFKLKCHFSRFSFLFQNWSKRHIRNRLFQLHWRRVPSDLGDAKYWRKYLYRYVCTPAGLLWHSILLESQSWPQKLVWGQLINTSQPYLMKLWESTYGARRVSVEKELRG